MIQEDHELLEISWGFVYSSFFDFGPAFLECDGGLGGVEFGCWKGVGTEHSAEAVSGGRGRCLNYNYIRDRIDCSASKR